MEARSSRSPVRSHTTPWSARARPRASVLEVVAARRTFMGGGSLGLGVSLACVPRDLRGRCATGRGGGGREPARPAHRGSGGEGEPLGGDGGVARPAREE